MRRSTRAAGVAEALVWGSGALASPEHLVAAWMTSAPHRSILLHPTLRRAGFGATTGAFRGHASVVVVTADLATVR